MLAEIRRDIASKTRGFFDKIEVAERTRKQVITDSDRVDKTRSDEVINSKSLI